VNGHPLDHIGIAVPDLDSAIPIWERLVGETATARKVVDTMGVEVVFLGSGPGRTELLAPTRSDSPVSRFLERRGPGLHHLCYRVPDIRAALTDLRQTGFVLIDEAPRPGADGHLVAFIHPRSTGGTLVELVEATDWTTDLRGAS
jgi:methylmalonyl-CoA epimerase